MPPNPTRAKTQVPSQSAQSGGTKSPLDYFRRNDHHGGILNLRTVYRHAPTMPDFHTSTISSRVVHHVTIHCQKNLRFTHDALDLSSRQAGHKTSRPATPATAATHPSVKTIRNTSNPHHSFVYQSRLVPSPCNTSPKTATPIVSHVRATNGSYQTRCIAISLHATPAQCVACPTSSQTQFFPSKEVLKNLGFFILQKPNSPVLPTEQRKPVRCGPDC